MMRHLQRGIPLLSAMMAALLVLLMVECARGVHPLDFEEDPDHWEADFRWAGRHCDLDGDDDEGPPVEILEALERECDDPIYDDEEDGCDPDWNDDEEPPCGDHDEPVCCPEYDDEEPDCGDDGDQGECEDPCGEATTQPPCTDPPVTTKAPPGGGDGSTSTRPPSGHQTTTKPPNGGGGSDIGAIIGGTIGGAAALAGIGAAAAGAGVALWRFFQRRAVPTEAATALEGTEMSTMNENALFQSGTDMHSNDLFQSAAVAPSDAV